MQKLVKRSRKRKTQEPHPDQLPELDAIKRQHRYVINRNQNKRAGERTEPSAGVPVPKGDRGQDDIGQKKSRNLHHRKSIENRNHIYDRRKVPEDQTISHRREERKDRAEHVS